MVETSGLKTVVPALTTIGAVRGWGDRGDRGGDACAADIIAVAAAKTAMERRANRFSEFFMVISKVQTVVVDRLVGWSVGRKGAPSTGALSSADPSPRAVAGRTLNCRSGG
jgi:hypothetical protein